jgi:hypothetical protein
VDPTTAPGPTTGEQDHPGDDPTGQRTGRPESSRRVDVHEQPPGVTMKPRVPSRTDEPT